LREQKINLVHGVAELGGPCKSAKEIKEGLRKLATDKAKQKALVTHLQFHKIVIQAKAPTKKHFQQGKSISG